MDRFEGLLRRNPQMVLEACSIFDKQGCAARRLRMRLPLSFGREGHARSDRGTERWGTGEKKAI